MKHLLLFCVWALALIIGGLLFWTSNEVQSAQDKKYALASQIQHYEDNISILSAEWHYLNSPAYLDQLTTVAFNTTLESPVLLADVRYLPRTPHQILPVRKPVLPESFQNQDEIIEIVENKVQSKPSFVSSNKISDQEDDFSIILASWVR